MTTLLLTHPACEAHDPGSHHPEHPGRLRAVVERLRQDFPALSWQEAPLAQNEHLAAAHSDALIETLARIAPESGSVSVDADTVMSPASLTAARAAAGAVAAGVDAVVTGTHPNVFCAVRPPGHHAERDQAMGFCLFNSVAVGALHALNRHGLERVAVADFDVHHGNGTQDIFSADPRVMFLSTHQMPLYPGTGGRDQTGVGNIVNVPLLSGSGGEAFREAVQRHWLPALAEFKPELLIVSAGFDAHRDDPLAGLKLTVDDYAWVTGELLAVADRHCAGRLVSSLEGGYNTQALADSVSAHVGALSARISA
ncbi:MAG: histone deacetylase family protein [Pseudomonadota bacterium]